MWPQRSAVHGLRRRILLAKSLEDQGPRPEPRQERKQRAALLAADRSTELRAALLVEEGEEPLNLGPAELEVFLQKDRAKYAERVKNANIKLD